jgi:DNA polymerase elongation subunit (family B)
LNFGAEIIYNDTDSAFIKFPNVRDEAHCNELGFMAAKYATKLFDGKTVLEFEKGGDGLFFKAKKYIIVTLDQKTNQYKWDYNDIIKRGVALQRRDYCPEVHTRYEYIMMKCMHRVPMIEVVDEFIKLVTDFVTSRVDYKSLIIVRKYGGNYKKDSNPLAVFAKYLVSIGKPPQNGDRVEYIVTWPRNVLYKKSGSVSTRFRDPEDYLSRLTGPEPEDIDFMYYLENQMLKPLEQLFQVSYRAELFRIGHTFYAASSRNYIYVFNPIKILLAMLKNNDPLENIRNMYLNPMPLVEWKITMIQDRPMQVISNPIIV